MKPLGTITSYLPFLDPDTAKAVHEEMDAAEDYSDFMRKLTDRVCREEPTEFALYLAVRHAFNLDAVDCLTKLSERYGNLPIARPFLFIESAQQGRKEDYAKAREAADVVLARNPPDWLAIEMHILKFITTIFDYPAGAFSSDTVDHVEGLIARNPSSAFFRGQLYATLAQVAWTEGDVERGIEHDERARVFAVECNDQYLLARILQSRALDHDIQDWGKSREMLREAGNILKTLGDTAGLADIVRMLGDVESMGGAYSAAIRLYTEALRILETLGAPTVFTMVSLCGPYADIGDGETALAWARMAELKGDASASYIDGCRLQQARALVLLGDLQQAREVIESTRDAVFRSGREINLKWLHFVEGILEVAEGDYSRGLTSLEEALELAERCHPQAVCKCLYELARAEVLAAIHSGKTRSGEGEGYWLARAEGSARSEDRPGVLGQVLLLKAELYLAQQKRQEARSVLNEVSSLATEPGLEFLHRDLDRLLEQVDDLAQ